MSTTTLVRGRLGETVARPDGVPKVTGEFAYSSDLNVPGMLHGATLRSPHAHARILSIDIAAALKLPGVHAVLTHDDVPGAKTYGLEFPDQPVLAIDRVRYDGEAVAVVAAESLQQARDAVRAIAVEYEPLPPVDDMARALEMPPLHPDRPTMGHGYREDERPNVVRTRRIRHGDPEPRARSSCAASTRSASRIRPSSARSRASRCPTARAASTSTSPRSGCTSIATRSRPASACRPSRCASTWPAWAAPSAAARISRCRSTARCWRCTRAARCASSTGERSRSSGTSTGIPRACASSTARRATGA